MNVENEILKIVFDRQKVLNCSGHGVLMALTKQKVLLWKTILVPLQSDDMISVMASSWITVYGYFIPGIGDGTSTLTAITRSCCVCFLYVCSLPHHKHRHIARTFSPKFGHSYRSHFPCMVTHFSRKRGRKFCKYLVYKTGVMAWNSIYM